MRLYLDTEYHGARRAQRLLSVGVVAEDGRWFYGELPAELARVVDHDDFFATHVTPQFGRVPGAAFVDSASLAAALRVFLAGLGRRDAAAPPGASLPPVPPEPTRGPHETLTLASDDRHDPWLLARLWQTTGATPPPWSTQDLRGLVHGPVDRAGLIAQGPLARRFGLRAHHALADAESLRLAAQRAGPPTVASMA